MPHPLDETYDGKEVTSVAVKIMKTGDGLSSALEVDPVCHHEGEPAYYLVKSNTRQIGYQRKKQTDRGLTRYETHDALEVVEIDGDLAEAILADRRSHLNTLREQRAEAQDTNLFNEDDPDGADLEPDEDE